MKITITVLLSIFILGACSKSPSTEEVFEACLASMIADMPESQRTEQNIQMTKGLLPGFIEQAKQEGKLEEMFLNCKKNQNGETAENDSSLDKLVEESKDVTDLSGDEIKNENTENMGDEIDALGD